MNCKYLKIRTKNYEKYIYCIQKKKRIKYKNCSNCKEKDYKAVKKIKKQSKKQKKKELKRFSIITDDMTNCYFCELKKDDIHEAIGGCNRQKSIEWGLTIPLCRLHHRELEDNQELKEEIQRLAQRTFESKYSHELFMKEFKRNYL